MNILIAGTGGVGGFFGAQLLQASQEIKDLNIYFLARGANYKAIQEKGIKVISDESVKVFENVNVFQEPPSDLKFDCVLLAVKTYDTEETLDRLKNSLTPDSLILPLQNGMNNQDLIRSTLADSGAVVGNLCLYIATHLESPGVVRSQGRLARIIADSSCESNSAFLMIQKALIAAGTPVETALNIQEPIWTKFIFISALAAVTSYRSLSIGETLEQEQARLEFETCLEEITNLARSLSISLAGDIVQTSLKKAAEFPFNAATSLQRDFQQGKKTELDTFLGSVLRIARKQNIQMPVYSRIYAELQNKTESLSRP